MNSISKYGLVKAASVFLIVFLITACEPHLQAFKGASITTQAQNAIDVLPENAAYVAMMNTQDLKENEYTDVLGANSLLGRNDVRDLEEQLEEFIAATGFDPYNDLQEVYVAMEEIKGETPEISAVAYASIDPEQLQNFVKEEAGNELLQRTYRGVDIFVVDKGLAPSFSFVNEDMIIAASNTYLLEDMIDRLQGEGASLSGNADMMELVTQASTGQSGWVVAQKPEMNSNMRSSRSLNEFGEMADQVWMAVDYAVLALNIESEGLDGQAFLYPNDDVAAEDLSSLMNGMVALVKASPEVDQEMLDVLDDIRAKAHGDYVQVGMYVENDMIEKIR